MKPIRGNPKEKSNLVLVEKDYKCDKSDNLFGKTKFWINGKSETRDEITFNDIIQVKNALSYNIYCSSLNITIYNRTIECPKETFVLPSNQSVFICDVQYKSQLLNMYTELQFIDSWSYAINHMLDPKMRENVYDNYLSKIDDQI